MLISDFPVVPPQSVPIVMVAEGGRATRPAATAERAMGVCYVVANVPEALQKYSAGTFPSQALVYPWEDVSAYFRVFDHQEINIYEGNAGPFDTSSAVIVRPPKHGKLVDSGRGEHTAYYYSPDPGYFGTDTAVIQAEVNGLKVKINYYFHSLDTPIYTESKVCGKRGHIWKISHRATPPSVDTTGVGSVSFDPLLNFAGIGGLDRITLDFASLASGALGQTTGQSITLDWNAAGHGWFIDPTPGLNEEFLPTADPTVWKAKPGSAAEGRMDLLSVLLHEYGHTLGLDHSAEDHDYMAATLQLRAQPQFRCWSTQTSWRWVSLRSTHPTLRVELKGWRAGGGAIAF